LIEAIKVQAKERSGIRTDLQERFPEGLGQQSRDQIGKRYSRLASRLAWARKPVRPLLMLGLAILAATSAVTFEPPTPQSQID
jgi:hypothetical protein